jgi:hypothetical protein
MIKNKRGALEFSFTWVFAIIAGMFILFLAIYGVSKFMSISRASQDAQTATDIGVLTNPLESGFETGKRTLMSTSVETRIYTGCTINAFFGRQTLKTFQKTYNKWSEEGVNVGFSNKYIFSSNPVEGKKFYLFSKPFEFPFKVGDLIYLTSSEDKYCFKNAPANIKKEIDDLTGNNLSASENFFTKTSDCPPGSINVCFNGGNNCDVIVNVNLKYVDKEGEKMYYEGDSLMYAAIFSNKDDYECQLNRLMKRTAQLSQIYKDKSSFVLKNTGCDSGLDVSLIQLKNTAENLGSSQNINTVYNLAEEISKGNDIYGECKLW